MGAMATCCSKVVYGEGKTSYTEGQSLSRSSARKWSLWQKLWKMRRSSSRKETITVPSVAASVAASVADNEPAVSGPIETEPLQSRDIREEISEILYECVDEAIAASVLRNRFESESVMPARSSCSKETWSAQFHETSSLALEPAKYNVDSVSLGRGQTEEVPTAEEPPHPSRWVSLGSRLRLEEIEHDAPEMPVYTTVQARGSVRSLNSN